MKLNLIFMIAGLTLLAGCSGSDDSAATDNSDTAVKNQVEPSTKNNVLSGYKTSLDTARSITSMAEESEKRKNQAIQDMQ